MSSPAAPGHDAHDDHAFTGEPVQVLSPDEPRTPTWIPLLGLALFTSATIFFLVGRDDPQPTPATPAAATAAAAPARAEQARPQPAPQPAGLAGGHPQVPGVVPRPPSPSPQPPTTAPTPAADAPGARGGQVVRTRPTPGTAKGAGRREP